MVRTKATDGRPESRALFRSLGAGQGTRQSARTKLAIRGGWPLARQVHAQLCRKVMPDISSIFSKSSS